MSQLLSPINGGSIPEVQTSLTTPRLNILSPQYTEVKNLQSRPTEWVPGGRPIYRRLPATAETYQVDFFNIAKESISSNTQTLTGVEKVGYVYVPYGQSINGPLSSEVVASDSLKDILIKAGAIIWEYGRTLQTPTIINLETLDVGSGKYDVAYQLIYDDSPENKLYSVENFALTGLPLTITSSTDSVIGWRYGAVNAFLNSSDKYWSNEDTFFPTYSQPTSSYIQWESQLSQAYSKLILRCPSGSAYSGTASLYYVDGSSSSLVQTVDVSSDEIGKFFQFSIDTPSLQLGWNVTFSSTTVSIQSILISGTITLQEPQATASPRSTLVMYPSGTLPTTVLNTQGEKIAASYCMLATVEVDNNYTLTDIQDARSIVHKDYTPIADWLTKPFDEDLINLYNQVSSYPSLWMAPPSCMMQEYEDLTSDQITVEA